MSAIVAQCSCGAKYKMADSMVGRRVRCKKCGEVFKIAGDAAAASPRLAELKITPDGGSKALLPTPPAPVIPAPVAAEAGPPVAVSYAPSNGSGKPTWAAFLPALLRSVLFVRRPRNLGTFAIAWGVLAAGGIGGGFLLASGYLRGMALGLFVLLLTEGSFAAFCFETARQSAAGEDELPSYPLTVGVDEWWSMLITPFFAYLGTSLLVLLPTIVCLIVSSIMASAEIETSTLGESIAVFGAMALGLFGWPMLILCVAIGGARTLLRVGPMIRSIFGTFASYATTVLIVYMSAAAVLFIAGFLDAGGVSGIGLSVLVIGLRALLQVAAMRAVGTYHDCYQESLAWMTD